MAKRLFVGGLPYSTSEAELRDLFSKLGELATVNVIVDKFTGQGKGFAFVEYVNDAMADEAIKTLSGTKIGDRTIVVTEARPMEERKPREYGGGGGYRGGGDRRDDRRGNDSYGSGRPKRW